MWWLILVLIMALLAGFGGWWYGVGRFTETPRLLEMTEGQARDEAAAAGLGVVIVETAFSERVPAGSVLATEPEPGERILDDGTIDVTLSRGKERYPVPELAGTALDVAADSLGEGGLALGDQRHQWSERFDEGVVIETVQRVGRMLRPDAQVDVVVSKGPRPIEIDDFTGEPAVDARRALRAAGFTVEVTDREFDESVLKGSIVAQDPSGGTGVRGDTVSLVVSRGPVLVEVPDLFRTSVDEAVAQLEAVGLVADPVQADVFLGFDLVAQQSVAAGETVPRGTTVVLTYI